jgi:thiosulfate dehydrogenase
MFKGLLIGILLGVVLVVGAVWFYFATGRAPVGVTEPPLPFEKKLAHGALNARIQKDGPKESLVSADEANFLAAADVYKENCAVCHGFPGGNKTTIAEGMYPDPPQMFHGTGVTDDPAWETHWKAENGIRMTGMPGFKGRLTDKQLWQVSQLLANADKISPAVRAALSNAPATPAAVEKETKKK